MGENVRTCIPHCHSAASACPPLRAGAGASLERKRPATAVDGGTSAAAPEAKRSRNDGTLPPHSPAGVQQAWFTVTLQDSWEHPTCSWQQGRSCGARIGAPAVRELQQSAREKAVMKSRSARVASDCICAKFRDPLECVCVCKSACVCVLLWNRSFVR